MRRFPALFGLLLPLLLALLVTPSLAQAPSETTTDLPTRIETAVAPYAERLTAVSALMAEDDGLSEVRLTALRNEIDQMDEGILATVADFQPQIAALDDEISRLPALPAEGEPAEPDIIAAERKRLTDLRGEVTLRIRDAELLAIRGAALGQQALERRRTQFFEQIFSRRNLSMDVFDSLGASSMKLQRQFTGLMSGWWRGTVMQRPLALLTVGLITLGSLLLLMRLLRPMRRWSRRCYEDCIEPTRLDLLARAFFLVVVPGAAFVVLAAVASGAMEAFGLYRPQVRTLFDGLLLVVSGWVFAALLLHSILQPAQPERRLVRVTDTAAKRLFWLGTIMAIIYGLDHLSAVFIEVFSGPVSLTVVRTLLATLLIAIALICVVTTRLNEPPAEGDAREGYRGWKPVLYWAVWSCLIAIVVAGFTGHVALARFIAGQIVVTGSILATMYLGKLAAGAIADEGALRATDLGRGIERRYAARRQSEGESFGPEDRKLDQLGLALSVLINIGVLMLGLPVLLLQWGFQIDDLRRWALTGITGFSIGGVEISVLRIALALGVFVVLLLATRALQRWFERRVLNRTQLDTGVRNSLKAGIGYVGFFVAALVGLSWAGFNLSNLAIIAGALSVGIGFGLQNIVNNFVSGIIMLVERPIRVGDIIAVSGTEGFVQKINVRATEIETFDRQTVIIPNSDVISTSVGNWMHGDNVRRVIVRVGVAYGSDVEKVRDILLEIAAGNERVATFPAPFVYFADFGSSSLDFELRVFLRDLLEMPFAETEMRFAIDREFRKHGVEIPFPQTDLHIRSGLPATTGAT